MKVSRYRVIFTAALLISLVLPAFASEFYYTVNAEKEHMSIIDPAQIVSLANGHKRFHEADIAADHTWRDTAFEVDCSGKRIKLISVIAHAGSVARDMTSANDTTNWIDIHSGSNDEVYQNIVCLYPDHKPSSDHIINFPDFQTAVESISVDMAKRHQSTSLNRGKSSAKILALGCLMYVNEYGTFPRQLSDIVPVGMTAENFKKYSIDPLSQDGVTFLYLGHLGQKSSVRVPLIVSQGKTSDGMSIVAYSDGSVEVEVYPKP